MNNIHVFNYVNAYPYIRIETDLDQAHRMGAGLQDR